MTESGFLSTLFKKRKFLALILIVLSFTALGMKSIEDGLNPSAVEAKKARRATRSTNIAFTNKDRELVVVNTEANSLTVFSVQGDNLEKLGEIPVGLEPHSVAVHPKRDLAFVTNSGSGTVSVVDLARLKVIGEVAVGTEPRGCALSPQGNALFVANFTSGTVSVIDTDTLNIIQTVELGGNPQAVAVTNDGDKNGDDETVFVSQFFAELIPGGHGEGFDDGKQAVVWAFPTVVYTPITKIVLSPLADSGFTANRTSQCLPPTGTGIKDTFCPQPGAPNGDPVITQDPQSVYPNQLHALLIRGNRLFVPSIGAQPEPPVVFNTNVQALVQEIDIAGLAQVPNLTVNLNAQIKTEPDPVDSTSLGKLFGNDIVALDANTAGTDVLIVSRGGNYVLRATTADENTPLTIDAPNSVIRFQTGNIPTGIVINGDGDRAYVNNSVNMSVSILDLVNNTTLALDVPSSTLPAPGSHAHSVLMGKLTFHTALGVPDNGLVGADVRSIQPRQFRGKQSNNAWSTCASCHPSGLADGVTWIFGDGPRNTIPLDGLYSKVNGAHDTRINNWSAARDSVTDFNNNSRNVQCGTGFAGGATNPAAGCPAFGSGTANPNIFDHGISQGASQALDMETQWTATIRPLHMPQPANPAPGRAVFDANCASCHGGTKWTKSQVLYLNNPSVVAGVARDAGVVLNGTQIVSYTDAKVDTGTLSFLNDVGTFNPDNPIEIRQNGQAPLGSLGFNTPSLLGVGSNAPYFHNGSAKDLVGVFASHALGGGTIQTTLSDQDRIALEEFLKSIDGTTQPSRSDADTFHEPSSNLP